MRVRRKFYTMKISVEGLALIKKFEGLELKAYQCAAGVWTIGYGHTKGVFEGQTIQKAEADEMLVEEMNEYENAVNNAVTISIDQCMFDALVSWTYNLGPSNLNASTMFTTFRSLHRGNLIITNKKITDCCLVEVRVVAVQAESAEIALPL